MTYLSLSHAIKLSMTRLLKIHVVLAFCDFVYLRLQDSVTYFDSLTHDQSTANTLIIAHCTACEWGARIFVVFANPQK